MANLEQYKEIIVDLLVEIGRYKEFEGRSEKLHRELAMEKQKNADLNNLITKNKVEHQQNLMSSIGTANGLRAQNKALNEEIKACEKAYETMYCSLSDDIQNLICENEDLSADGGEYLRRISNLKLKHNQLVHEIEKLNEIINGLRSLNPAKQNDKLWEK
jgi:hypothetical protein